MCSFFTGLKGDKPKSWMTRPALCLIFAVVGLLTVVILYSVLPPALNSKLHNEKDSSEDQLLVNTRYGSVRGAYDEQAGVLIFSGVPYAKPPTGSLRWRAPVEPEPWSPNVYDATRERPGCPQECSNRLFCSSDTSEDCLFLTLYVPGGVKDLVPVMVYYHGGRFQDATSTLPIYDATAMVQRSQVIVVLVEFRLGALGYLVTGQGEDHATGNYGIQDQRHALKWVSENIISFGGDPDKVTLAGQSSGAQSVLIDLVSEASRHFRSVIIESAPMTLPYRLLKDATGQGRTFAETLNCIHKNAVNMTCLRQKTPEQVIEAQKTAGQSEMDVTTKIELWSPVIDGRWVTSQPLDALRKYVENSTEMKPIICSYTTEEGLNFVKTIFHSKVPYMVYTIILNTVLKNLPEDMDKLYPIADMSDTREVLSQILTDLVFRCPLRYFVKMLKTAGHGESAWIYAWDRPIEAALPVEYAMCTNRTCHNTQIPYAFHSFSRIFNSSSDKDLQLSYILIDFYANFIKSGSPTSGRNGTPIIEWPSAATNRSDAIARLIFTRDARLQTATDDNDVRCDAWDQVGYSVIGKNKK